MTPPYDAGSRFDRDLEKQEELDRKRLAKKKELEPEERQKLRDIIQKWLNRRREP